MGHAEPAEDQAEVPTDVPVQELLPELEDLAVLVIDHDLRYLSAGGGGLAAAGWAPAELIGRTLHEVVTAAEAARLEPTYRAALAGQRTSLRIQGIRRPDRVHDIEVLPLADHAGTVTSAMVIAREVTERLAHERAAAAAEERLRALARGSADMLALYDPDGVYLEVSPAAMTLFGWDPDELVGTNAYDYFHPDDLELISTTHAAVLETDQVGPIEYRLRCRDGSYRWVEVVGRQLRDPTGEEVVAIQCTTRDISRRRTAEEALRASEARFRTAMLHAPIGKALVDLDGRFLEVNTALASIVGLPPEHLVGRAYHDLVAHAALPASNPVFADLLDGARSTGIVSTRYVRSDGSELQLDLHAAVVRDAGGAPLSVIVQVVDTTEQRAAEAQLRRANEELERFAAVASHDLRSPLATAQGLLALLDDRIPLPEASPARDVIDRAQRQLHRLSETVDALLELTQAGTTPLQVREVAATDLLAEVTEAMEDLREPTGSTVELTADATLTGDPRLLRSLVQNLVSNALRATDSGRPVHVQIAAHRFEDHWTLEVVDDGDGIPEHLREDLFEPFVHADRPGHSPGHGLGLPICRRVTERHGGSIEVGHLTPGTRFLVTIPIRAPGAAT